MAPPKGHIKYGGRKKGAPNKLDQEARELFVQIISKQTENVDSCLEQLAQDDPFKYLMVVSKLLTYIMPKQIDIKSDGQQLPAPIIQLSPNVEPHKSKR